MKEFSLYGLSKDEEFILKLYSGEPGDGELLVTLEVDMGLDDDKGLPFRKPNVGIMDGGTLNAEEEEE